MKKVYDWYVEGNYVQASISGSDTYFCTGEDGHGLFKINCAANSRCQILGTADFSVVGVKDKIGKVRRNL